MEVSRFQPRVQISEVPLYNTCNMYTSDCTIQRITSKCNNWYNFCLISDGIHGNTSFLYTNCSTAQMMLLSRILPLLIADQVPNNGILGETSPLNGDRTISFLLLALGIRCLYVEVKLAIHHSSFLQLYLGKLQCYNQVDNKELQGSQPKVGACG